MPYRPSPAESLTRLGARLAARGPLEIARTGIERLIETVWSDDVLILLVRVAGGARPELEGFELRPATAADAPAYAEQIGTDSPRTFRARVAGGDRCYVVASGERFVHATWVTTSGAWTREIRRYLRPPEGDAYIYESFTDPGVRGRGLYPFAINAIAAELGRDEIRRIWVGVVGDNEASLRAVAKGGFVEAFRIRYRRRFGALMLGEAEGPEAPAAGGMFARTM